MNQSALKLLVPTTRIAVATSVSPVMPGQVDAAAISSFRRDTGDTAEESQDELVDEE